MENILKNGEREDKSLRELIYFPAIYNMVGLPLLGALYATSPSHSVKPETLNTVLYMGVFATQWSLAYMVVRRLGIGAVKELIAPKKKLRWPPSILVFASLNALFTAYIALGLRYGRIPPWGDLNPLQAVFFLVLNPFTARFVEELIWRGYFIEKLQAAGKTKWRAIVYSSISFAFIHGFFVPDKLAVTFLFGVIAAAYYYSERNIPVLMASHVVLDVIAFGLPFWA